MLLARLALFCVMLLGFGPCSAVSSLTTDSTLRSEECRRQEDVWAHSASHMRRSVKLMRQASFLSLWEYRNSRDRMNLHPLCMETVLDQSANHLNARTHRRQRHLIGVVCTRRFGILL